MHLFIQQIFIRKHHHRPGTGLGAGDIEMHSGGETDIKERITHINIGFLTVVLLMKQGCRMHECM